jgi:AcrR family transcriptional regulator
MAPSGAHRGEARQIPITGGPYQNRPDWQDGRVTYLSDSSRDQPRRRRTRPAAAAARATTAPTTSRVRMSAAQRREQLIAIGRQLFAERGFDGTSVEEVAARAKVSKPVVYEHFGGKEGLYAVVVDREVRALLDRVAAALTAGHPHALLEQAALALLDYIEEEPHGFRVLVRESPVLSPAGNFSNVMNDVAHQVEHILADEFRRRGFDPKFAELYSQALVGMVALVGQWWREARKPKKEMVAAHLVNLAWNGLSHLEAKPTLLTRPMR